MKKILRMFWKMLTSHLLLKIVAFLFALVFWSYILTETNPPREKTFRDIPVSFVNIEMLTEKGLTIRGSLSEIIETVEITVEANQNRLRYITEESVEAKIDLASVNGMGETKLKIRATPAEGTVISVKPSEVSVEIDQLVEKTVPVTYAFTGSPAENYYIGEPGLTPDVITLKGARTDVERVANAKCMIDVNGLTDGYNKSMNVTLLDQDGETVDSDYFNTVPSVIVNIEVLPKKTVDIDLESSIVGLDEIAPGYEVLSISAEPDTIEIAGALEDIKDIDSVVLNTISVSGAEEDITMKAQLKDIEGVTFLNGREINVLIVIREIQEERSFENIDISASNRPGGLRASISPDSTDVMVTAGARAISALERSDVVAYVDLDGLSAGVYTLPVKFELIEGFTEESFVPEHGSVQVTLE